MTCYNFDLRFYNFTFVFHASSFPLKLIVIDDIYCSVITEGEAAVLYCLQLEAVFKLIKHNEDRKAIGGHYQSNSHEYETLLNSLTGWINSSIHC